jgi:hypothetical protein
MAMDHSDARATNAYWGRDGIERAILDALAASGKNTDALSVDDLAPADQFHSGGKGATERLSRMAELKPGMRVLDVGGGLGGPARRRRAGARRGRSVRCGVDPEQRHEHSRQGAAPRRFRAGAPSGRIAALQEPMAGPMQPVLYPVMWARDAGTSFLRAPGEMRKLIEAAGFQVRRRDDVTAEAVGPSTGAASPAHSIQRIAMGDAVDAIAQSGQKNREEGRIVMIQAVLERRATPA